MTWRVRLAMFILRSDPNWMVCQIEDFAAYIRLLVEEDRVRTLVREHDRLGPVLTLLSPQKNETRH